MIRIALFFLCALIGACGFGHQLERPDELTLVENLGGNRYVYRSRRLVQAPARGAAMPVLATPPAGAKELGLIEVSVEYGGFRGDGLRDCEADFYARLAQLAGEMGGTNFVVLRSTRETRPVLGNWITSLTVDVLRVSD
jgi:hypothetical protein